MSACIKSILAQTYQNWEAIIVDNYSVDNTAQIVSSYDDRRIIFVQNHNYGVISVSRNKALDLATGDWICFLDSDDAWVPNKLETLLEYVHDYDLIYHGYMRNFKRSLKTLFLNKYSFFYDVKEPSVAYVLQRGDPFNPSCTAVAKSVIGDTRFSEEKSLIAVEDYDFFLQLLEKSIKIKYIRKPMTIYDLSGCSHDGNSYMRDQKIINKWGNRLNEEEKKELYLQECFRKANDLMNEKYFADAIPLYKEVINTKINSKKYLAIRNLLYCKVMVLFI